MYDDDEYHKNNNNNKSVKHNLNSFLYSVVFISFLYIYTHVSKKCMPIQILL